MPASSANLGPGFDCMAAALALQLELEVEETGEFAIETDLPVARGRENLCVRAFERLHPADGFTFRIRSEIPLSGGLGSSAAAIVAGLMAADHLFELDADLLRTGERRSRAIPTTSPPSLLGGFVICADGQATRFDPPTGLEALAVVPDAGGAHPRRARGAAAAGAARRGRVQRRPRRAADARARPRGLGPGRARPAGPAAPAAPLRTCSLAPMSWRRARASWGRWGRRSPAPGRPCWCGASTSRRAPWPRRCAREVEGWASCCGLRSSPRAPTSASSERAPRRRLPAAAERRAGGRAVRRARAM